MKTSPSNPALRALCLVVTLLFAALPAVTPSLCAQPAPAPASAPASAPLKVGTITVQFATTDSPVGEQVVRANMRLREGMEFDSTDLDHDLRSLYATGHFSQVDIHPTERPDHSAMDIAVLVTPKLRVLAVHYEGYSKIKPDGFLTSGFGKDVKTKAGDALDEQKVHTDAEAIRDYYQKAGYNQATVTYRIDRSGATSTANVTFVIAEGSKVAISAIRFTGNDHVKAKLLLKEMDTTTRGFFSWITGSGYLEDDKFEADLDKLVSYYKDQGYLDVEIPPREKIIYEHPSANKLVITIPVKEGRQYHVGAITISGNTIIPTPDLLRLLKQRTGAIFAPTKMNADTTALQDAFGSRGYLETTVKLVQPHPGSDTVIDIEYVVNEGELVHVESIQVEGNTKTKNLVIIRELSLGPGDVFDTVRMRQSQKILENTRFFEEVRLTDEPTAIPGRRDLKIAVKEAQTGSLNFGVGYSSLERLVATAEITQSNFDMFNSRSLYQGAGQKFRILLQLGTLSSNALLSFEEPWLFQQRLTLGYSIYRTSTGYDSTFYDEIRTGGQVYLRKVILPNFGNRLIGVGDIEAQLTYTLEAVDITRVTADAPAIIQEQAGAELVSKVGLTFSRETRDKLLYTTTGNHAEFTAEVAGGPLGANVSYYRLEARGSQFFKLAETQTQVLGLIGRIGVIDNFGQSSQVPFFDRYFLGGPYTLRGFDYREVGPKDPASGEPIGGDSYGMASAEYSFEVFNPVRFAFFYDAGFVNADPYDFSLRDYNSDVGFGLRVLLNGAPLNLDFGFPIVSDKLDDKGLRFNFSIGTRF